MSEYSENYFTSAQDKLSRLQLPGRTFIARIYRDNPAFMQIECRNLKKQ